jgi:hypothetical protein
LESRQTPVARTRAENSRMSWSSALRFSILQLMLLVLVLAVLIKVGPFARAHLNDYHSYMSSLVAVVAGGLCFGGVTLVAAWGALATRQPLAWSLVAVALSAAIGLLPPYYFPQFLTLRFRRDVGHERPSGHIRRLHALGGPAMRVSAGTRRERRDSGLRSSNVFIA